MKKPIIPMSIGMDGLFTIKVKESEMIKYDIEVKIHREIKKKEYLDFYRNKSHAIVFNPENTNNAKRKENIYLRSRIMGENIIFMPVCHEENIIDFTFILEEDLVKTGGDSYLSLRGYPKSEGALHGKIFGKVAEKGGWKKIYSSLKHPVQKALWITGISGRSKDQNDPNPDNKDYWYYYDKMNELFIKAATWTENSIWHEIEEENPNPKLGDVGDYCKNKYGDIFIKVDQHFIDHINGNSMDNRKYNLREITCSANSANKDSKKEGCKGVSFRRGKYSAKISFRNKSITKTFDREIDAAKFYDYYIFALHGVYIKNNKTLNMNEIENLLINGISAIPEFYVYERQERDLPVGISLENGLFRVKKQYNGKLFRKNYRTIDEAVKALEEFESMKEEMIKEENDKKLGDFSDEDEYCYIKIIKDDVEYKFKVNTEAYKELGKVSWSIGYRNEAHGAYKGKKKALYVHVYEFYNPDYDKNRDGSIDHVDGDLYDCTIEKLRAANLSLQAQNKKTVGVLPYIGVSLKYMKFEVSFQKTGKSFVYLQDAINDYNNKVIQKYGVDSIGKPLGKINEYIPEGKTTVADLYKKENFNREDIEKFALSEIKAFIMSNKDIRGKLDVRVRNIKMENYKEIRTKVIEMIYS